LGAASGFPGDLNTPVAEIVGDLEVDRRRIRAHGVVDHAGEAGRPTTRPAPSDRLQRLREPCRVRRVARRQHSFDLLSSIRVDAVVDGIQSFAASIAAPDLSPAAPTPGFTEGDRPRLRRLDRLIDPVVTQAMPSRPPDSSGRISTQAPSNLAGEQTNTGGGDERQRGSPTRQR
jgi:hypothetical protein